MNSRIRKIIFPKLLKSLGNNVFESNANWSTQINEIVLPDSGVDWEANRINGWGKGVTWLENKDLTPTIIKGETYTYKNTTNFKWFLIDTIITLIKLFKF